MSDAGTPVALLNALTELFPAFASKWNDEQPETLHQVVQRLAPLITGYLEGASEKTVRRFCELVNSMVAAGGQPANAIATCLLEHASQVRVKGIIRPHLSPEARRELR